MAVSCVEETASTVSESIAQSIKAQGSPTNAGQDSRDRDAREALARGEALRANWTAASLRQAIDEYEKAAFLWTSISYFPHASEATLKAGAVYFLLSEYPQALERYQRAEVLAKKTGDWLVEATALSQMGYIQSYRGDNDLAQRQLTQALDLFKRHEVNRSSIAANANGEALSNLAEVSYAKGDFIKASQQLDSALNVIQKDQKGDPNADIRIDEPVGNSDTKAVTEEDGNKIFSQVEKMPEFPGGLEAFGKYLSDNIKFPAVDRENGVSGKVFCQFVVEKDGSLTDIVAVRGPSQTMKDEAVRVLKRSPKWKPGIQNSRPVRVSYTVPINFTLETSE